MNYHHVAEQLSADFFGAITEDDLDSLPVVTAAQERPLMIPVEARGLKKRSDPAVAVAGANLFVEKGCVSLPPGITPSIENQA